MFENDFSENDQPRRSGKRHLSWLFLLGGVLVVGGLLLAWQVVLHTAVATPAHSSVPTSQPGLASATSPSSSPGTRSLSPQGPPPTPLYYQTFEQQVAQGLHLTVPEVKTRLQSTPSLFALARNQGLTQQQAYNLVINALRAAGDKMVSTNVWTRQQADADLQSWQQRDQEAVDGGSTKLFMQ
jgi:hypothetical protein